MGTESLLLMTFHPDQVSQLVVSHVVQQMADHTDNRTMETVGHESFVTSVVTGVMQN